MRGRYVELLGDALKIEPSPTDYLARHRRGLLRHRLPALVGVRGAAPRPSCASVRQRLVRKRREAGSLLRELWAVGQRPTADELLKDVTGAAIEMEAVADRVASTSIPSRPHDG